MRLKVLSVTEINKYIKSYLNGNPILNSIKIKGEISNYKKHSSGHVYFTLKDGDSSIKCVMFKSYEVSSCVGISNGDEVIVTGRVDVYLNAGSYQIYVNSIEKLGAGELYIQFENLKNKLMLEGVFDPSLKKELPKFPSKVAVITSDTGAAIRDIINVVKRRNPLVDIVIYPALVQGVMASESIINALDKVSVRKDIDAIILARGGGSIEDLAVFNDEDIARAILKCDIPIVSGVGHETDFTICDFVCDVRASTPSASAEILIPSMDSYIQSLVSFMDKITEFTQTKILDTKNKLDYYNPNNLLNYIDNLLLSHYQSLDNIMEILDLSVDEFFIRYTNELEKILLAIDMSNPINLLKKGYSMLYGANDEIVTTVKEIKIGDEISLKLLDGSIKSKVIDIDLEE